jgi:hypothetical protein
VTVVIIQKRLAFGEAIHYTGDNAAEIVAWANGHAYIAEGPTLYIETRTRGDVPADPGDWIVLGPVTNDYYPCEPEAYDAGWQAIGERT